MTVLKRIHMLRITLEKIPVEIESVYYNQSNIKSVYTNYGK